MSTITKPTLNQRRAFENVLAQTARGEKTNLYKAQIDAGYSPATAKTTTLLTKSKGWQTLIASIDDGLLMEKVNDIALGDDKRAALAAVDMIMKLKDRYPAGKLKLTQYDDEISKITE